MDHGRWPMRAAVAATVAAFAALCLVPSLGALLVSLEGPEGWPSIDPYRTVLTEARQWRLLGTSLAIGLGSAALATVLGVSAGIALEYFSARGRRLLRYGLTAPFLLPPYLAAIAWIDLLGRQGLVSLTPRDSTLFGPYAFNIYSLGGVIWSLGASYFPVVMWFTAAALRRLDGRLEEAALLIGSRPRALFRIVLPLIAPSALTGSNLVFILGLTSFSVPSLLQVNAYPVEIYSIYSSSSDFGRGAALSIPLLLLGGATLLGARGLMKRRAWLDWEGRGRPAGLESRTGAWLATAFCAFLFLATVAAPLATIAARALPLSSLSAAWRTADREIGRSLALSATVAVMGLSLGVMMASLERRRAWSRLFAASVVPFLLSGPALGVALIRIFNRDGLASIVLDSALILVMAQAARFLVFAHQGAAVAIGGLPPRFEEAAALAGAGPITRLGAIVIPLASPGLISTLGLVFVLGLGELDVSILVYPPGMDTLPIRLFGLMHYGPSQLTSALCLITAALVLGSAAAMAALAALLRRYTGGDN